MVAEFPFCIYCTRCFFSRATNNGLPDKKDNHLVSAAASSPNHIQAIGCIPKSGFDGK